MINVLRKIKYCITLSITLLFIEMNLNASVILIPMDQKQSNHLKAYGMAYWVLNQNLNVDWLLNYRGGSFAIKHLSAIEKECKIRGIKYELLADVQYTNVLIENWFDKKQSVTIQAEVADEPDERALGLMNRKIIGKNNSTSPQ